MNDLNDKLPIALISPHGGLQIPPELNGRIALTPEQIFNEADAYIDEIFDFRDRVLYYETFPYARCLIDLNRPHHGKLNHRRGDGIVKQQTSYGDPIFLPGQQPDEQLEDALVQEYHTPWHHKLAQIAADTRVKLVIDCHSMAGRGPSAYEHPFAIRPFAMVGNMGNQQGEVREPFGMVTATPELTRCFANALNKELTDVEPFMHGSARVGVNDPYAGGWDIFAHGGRRQPWVMVELSRALYIGDQTAYSPIVPPREERLALLREKVWRAIETVAQSEFFDYEHA